MTITLLFMAGLMAVVVWWLVRQTIAARPWVAQGQQGATEDFSDSTLHQPVAKLGLYVFLAVVTSLFALFISAYVMRMKLGDWRPLPEPDLLWINTGALILSSIALQWARVSAHQEQADRMRVGLLAGGVFALAFMVGQLLAWQQLVDLGYFVNTNPANAFFYLITGLHGLHLLGGLVAWSRTTIKVFGGMEVADVRLSVELCAIYWHFLLLVWMILFGLMLST
ncbi:MAG: cytochrome c oxidase subunit 3 [Gammaproteobacteria bacterium]